MANPSHLKRRYFTKAQKTEILKEFEANNLTCSERAGKHRISPILIYKWRKNMRKEDKIPDYQAVLSEREEKNRLDKRDLAKALKKTADFLSCRSHSEKELALKLSRMFDSEVVKKTLAKAKQNQWLESPQELAQKSLALLSQKNKSWWYIANQFQEKGLPPPPFDKSSELEKARRLALKKYPSLSCLSLEKKRKLKQSLCAKGFDAELVDELLALSSYDLY